MPARRPPVILPADLAADLQAALDALALGSTSGHADRANLSALARDLRSFRLHSEGA